MGIFQRPNRHQSGTVPQRIINRLATAIAGFTLIVTPCLVAQPPRPLRLARMTPLPIPRHPIARAEKEFPFFSHQPIASAGFNALFLPFHHAFAKASHGFNRAQAFAFLFSLDLDWAPGSYCNRHAYFLYNRSGANMVHLLRHYSKGAIARYFPGWKASVAVGGTLKHGVGGYTAKIVLYNRQGHLIHTMHYNTPMTFWKLLATVDAGFMTYIGEPPSPALVNYLSKPRCRNMKCLTELGKAAFLPIQSTRAFALFREVLRLDPHFAEVRYWFENQRSWRGTLGDDIFESELAQILKDRLSPYAAIIFDPSRCRNPQLAAKLATLEPAILAESKKLTGADSPLVLTEELNWKTYKVWSVPSLLHRATQVAGLYPNDYNLLQALAQLYENRKFMAQNNPDMAGAIDAVAMGDRWLPGDGLKTMGRIGLANAASSTGHARVAAVMLLQSQSAHNRAAGLWALAQFGQFNLIVRLAPHFLVGQPVISDEIVAIYAFAAAAQGDRPVLDSIIRTYPKELHQQGLLRPMKYCSRRLAGKNTTQMILNQPKRVWPGEYIYIYLQIERGFSRRQEVYLNTFSSLFIQNPMDRLNWFYIDVYTRQEPHPSPDDPDYYNVLPWIFPHDPWAKLAVRQYLARTKARPARPMNPDFVLSKFAALKPYQHRESGNSGFNLAVFNLQLPNISIFNQMAAVHQFVQKREFTKANRMAHVLFWYAQLHDFPSMQLFFRHLLYLETQAQQASKKLRLRK